MQILPLLEVCQDLFMQPQECVTQLKLKSTDTAVVKRHGPRPFSPNISYNAGADLGGGGSGGCNPPKRF